MKTLLVLFCVLCLCPTLSALASTTTPQDDHNRGILLYGKVRIVDSGADFKLRIVNADAFLDIHPLHGGSKLDALVAKAGASRKANPKDLNHWGYTDWEFVNSGEDFTVEFVNSGEFCTVKFVFDTIGLESSWKKMPQNMPPLKLRKPPSGPNATPKLLRLPRPRASSTASARGYRCMGG